MNPKLQEHHMYHANNKIKCRELQSRVYWAAGAWLDACEKLGYKFTVTEVFRDQQRQDRLYGIGRWLGGDKPVTWTLSSTHSKRLAVDIVVDNCTYHQVGAVAIEYGIRRPLGGFPLYDEGHLEFTHVKSYPIILSVEAKIKALTRGIKRKLPPVKTMLQNQLKRLLSRSK